MISTVEFRDQNDPEILEHTHDKSIETLIVHPQPEMTACYQLLYATLREVIAPLLQNGVCLILQLDGLDLQFVGLSYQ